MKYPCRSLDDHTICIGSNIKFLALELLYYVSPSPGSDVSTHTQVVIACTHSTSLPGDGETEYSQNVILGYK